MTRLLALVWPELRAPKADTRPFAPMLDALDDLSPRVEAVDLGVALLDVTGLGPMLGGADERRVAARAVALCRAIAPLAVRCGIGDNRWLASLAARLAHPAPPDAPAALHVLASGRRAARDALRDLPLGLLPADAATGSRFGLFGLTTMGQLAALPRSAVGAQFGVAGERLQALARGEDPRPLVPRRRPERVSVATRFEPPVDDVGAAGLALRRSCAELCEQLRARNLAPGRAILTLSFEDAATLRVPLAFPAPALEPDWIARLVLSRVEALARNRARDAERRVAGIELAFDRLTDPAVRQLPAFEARAGRWEELRWSLERVRHRFGKDRLWRAVHERPTASLPEHRSRLVDIGLP